MTPNSGIMKILEEASDIANLLDGNVSLAKTCLIGHGIVDTDLRPIEEIVDASTREKIMGFARTAKCRSKVFPGGHGGVVTQEQYLKRFYGAFLEYIGKERASQLISDMAEKIKQIGDKSTSVTVRLGAIPRYQEVMAACYLGCLAASEDYLMIREVAFISTAPYTNKLTYGAKGR